MHDNNNIYTLYNVALKTASSGNATVYLPGENNCNFTTTIMGLTASNDTLTNIPVSNPYGFASMPDKSYTAVIGSLGIRSQSPVVLGYTNGVKSISPLQLAQGETGLYNSTNFSFEMKLTELRARFNGISCKIVNGNADQILLSDIFNEFIDLVSYLNTQTQSIYNTHIHDLPPTIPLGFTVSAPSGGGACTVTPSMASPISIPVVSTTPTGAPIPTMAAYSYTNPIVSDATYIDDLKLFIDDNGVMP